MAMFAPRMALTMARAGGSTLGVSIVRAAGAESAYTSLSARSSVNAGPSAA
jgi:hypothetical protein